MFAYNISLTPDGILPPDKWIETISNNKMECLQVACNRLHLEQLPFTIHITQSSMIRRSKEKGLPIMTTAYTIDVINENEEAKNVCII